MVLKIFLSVLMYSQENAVQPMRTKSQEKAGKTFGRMFTETKPLKAWSNKGPSTKELSKSFVEGKASTLSTQTVK